jgi:CRP-like cAMP-binding protein
VSGSRSRILRDKVNDALRKERFEEALVHYTALEMLERNEPRWPHRKGDLLKRVGRRQEAVGAYERAVDLYAQQGFVARAAAMAKVITAIAPERVDVFERLRPEAARELLRAVRPAGVKGEAYPESDEGEPLPLARRISVDALPLVANESATDDLLRFTKPPSGGSPTLDLDISDAELEDHPLTLDGLSEGPSAERLAQLPSMALFAEVPRAALEAMVRESRLVDLEPGENLIDSGTTADALYSLIEGSVEVVRPNDEHTLVLSEGDVVGISCLLNQVCYEGDATARTKVRALRISKLLLDRLVAEHPALENILLEVLGRRLIATLLRTSPMFSSLDNGDRSKVASMFEVRRAERGTSILKAGKRADGLYIPMIGELTAYGPKGEELGRLKLGRALGQDSMLSRARSPLTVRAASDVLVLRLSTRRFNKLVSGQPQLVAHLEDLAKRPSSPGFSLLPEPLQKKGA